MEKVLFFDVEYANAKNKSICQLGLLSEYFPSGDPVFPEKNIYINPEDGFQDWCTRIHGITEQKVENEPNFSTVWNDIEPYFSEAIIIGHNVLTSDLIALAKACDRYNIQLPPLYYIDIMYIARKYIPSWEIENYSLHNLCEYFDIDTDKAHDAFDDACATSDVFKCLLETFDINMQDYIETFSPKKSNEFIEYVSDSGLRRTMSEFYGAIQGFSFDNKIRPEEEAYIKHWYKDNIQFENKAELKVIFKTLNKILKDNIITIDEMNELKRVVKDYYQTILGSKITISLQELHGILKGIIIDNIISTEEAAKLIKWMYNNINLSEHYPYNHILSLFETVLEDNIITEEESKSLISIINSLLTPVDSLKEQITAIENKHICLSGNFSYGKKAEVEKVIIQKKGIIDSTVKKTTDILVIGDYESEAYAHGNYGTKVRQAMEFSCKGCDITIIKEKEFFAQS